MAIKHLLLCAGRKAADPLIETADKYFVHSVSLLNNDSGKKVNFVNWDAITTQIKYIHNQYR